MAMRYRSLLTIASASAPDAVGREQQVPRHGQKLHGSTGRRESGATPHGASRRALVERVEDFQRCARRWHRRLRRTRRPDRAASLRTIGEPRALRGLLPVGRQSNASLTLQECAPDLRPGDRRVGIGEMFGPPTIELRRVLLGERQMFLSFRVGQAFPESHCQFDAIAGRELEKLRKRARFHSLIVSRDEAVRKAISPVGRLEQKP